MAPDMYFCTTHPPRNMSNKYSLGASGFSMSSLPRMSSAIRGTSVHGGAGGRNTRLSYPSNGLGSGFDMAGVLGSGVGGGVGSGSMGNSYSSPSENKKLSMQNLNDRLATYMDKVHSLEAANAKLELQIREWYDKQTPAAKDYSKYEAIIEDLRRKIRAATQDNARLMLQIDNARLAAEDFRIKFENEMALRMSVEADIVGLRKVLDDLTMARADLEMQVEGLKEEMIYLKKNHAEEMVAMRNQVKASSVSVEVDARPQNDMARTMDKIRGQYEAITDKNRREMEEWYKVKFDELNKNVTSSTESLQSSRSEMTELKRTLQALQIELQSHLSLKSALEGQLEETESSYGLQLNQLQGMVNGLEEELKNVRADSERQAHDYQLLLDIKNRLEMEIAEYRRLLDGEERAAVPMPPKPVFSQRRMVVIEEIIDGKVVSRKEEFQ
ncbi:keratin, type I cytoskeletal 19-like isoform X1 [Pseudoliparis swirei]|uniref:keratin, type I cytoskeletal 19-like isoform X1 n=1 Tax=Pseudoliparis swirei TaxID=2059687 RepID=UPI0024BE9E3E|nr:keratin, type I cytoskeletal 19-like isoform X1 [Pseudoliparis swirei]